VELVLMLLAAGVPLEAHGYVSASHESYSELSIA
jgi:hypothetical protein